ncbi:MAG: ATP-binding protein [Pseudomonadota bacterium]
MITQSINQVDEALLNALVADRASESTTVDFKAIPYDKSDNGKLEFAKDVCAFANAEGGDIVIGLSSTNYTASALKPIEGEQFDALARRLTEVLNSRVEPRVPGIAMREVRLAAGGYAIVVRVPSSYDGPHSFRTAGESRRFVVRNGVGITDMSIDQIRNAFDRTATLADRANDFIRQRLSKIAARDTSNPILAGPVWALHVSPLSGLSGKSSPPLSELYQTEFTRFLESDWGGGSRTFNFDGLTIHPGGDWVKGHYTYAQIFRNGTIECASTGGAKRVLQDGGEEKSIVWSLDMSKFFWRRTLLALTELKRMGFSGPALIGCALLTAKGYELGIGDVFSYISNSVADRSNFIVPPVYVEDIETVNLSSVLRPALDAFWQIFDRPRCLDFDEHTGEFNPRRS